MLIFHKLLHHVHTTALGSNSLAITHDIYTPYTSLPGINPSADDPPTQIDFRPPLGEFPVKVEHNRHSTSTIIHSFMCSEHDCMIILHFIQYSVFGCLN